MGLNPIGRTTIHREIMISTFILKTIFRIAQMSKKTSAIFVSILSFVFCLSVFFLIDGLVFIDPIEGITSPIAIPFISIGGSLLFLSVFLVAMTTLASNYGRKYPEKNPKKGEQKEVEAKE